MKHASIVFALLVALATSAAAQQWAGRGRVKGAVTNEQGEVIAGAQVRLQLDGKGPEPLVTDKQGRWSKLGLAQGTWTLVVDAAGYVGAQGTVKIIESGPGTTLDIKLRRPTAEELAQSRAGQRSAVVETIEQGNALIVAKDFAGARAKYEEALLALPAESQLPVLRAIANSWYAEGDVERAIAAFDRALALQPDDSEILQAVVNVLVSADREAEAEAYLARLPADAQLAPATLLNFGIEAYNKGEMTEAFEHFDRLVRQNPEYADGYYFRGLVELNRQNNAAAAADFNRLLELAPDHPKAAEVREFLSYLES